MKYIGIDLHKKQSQMCPLPDAGELLHTHLPMERSQLIAGAGTDRALWSKGWDGAALLVLDTRRRMA